MVQISRHAEALERGFGSAMEVTARRRAEVKK